MTLLCPLAPLLGILELFLIRICPLTPIKQTPRTAFFNYATLQNSGTSFLKITQKTLSCLRYFKALLLQLLFLSGCPIKTLYTLWLIQNAVA